MLCTSLRFWGVTHGLDGEELYNSTHVNHPCNKWIREAGGNWIWLYWHMRAMCLEYKRRFDKAEDHLAFIKARSWNLSTLFFSFAPMEIQVKGTTPFVNCASNASLDLNFRDEPDVNKAYRKYLSARWYYDSRPPKCSVLYLHDEGHHGISGRRVHGKQS